ncbi:MAG: GNAT family N-acetyltransferase [Chitinivibrionales bacterium]|nr:GNAT family N-acetyltransferase [Chitinivibrionales bacterium]
MAMEPVAAAPSEQSPHRGVVLPQFHVGHRFKCKVPLEFDTEKFVVKTVDNTRELKRVLRLRYDVYYKELIERNRLRKVDRDRFDARGDHLAVIEKSSNEVVATYRLFCSTFTRRFYSETEFDIDAIKELPGDKLELGRACVRKEYRKGVMIILLWRAIAHYLRATGARYLFGCSSVKTVSIPQIAKVHAILSRMHFAPPQYRVYPRPKHRIKDLAEHTSVWENVEMVDRGARSRTFSHRCCISTWSWGA